MPVDRAGSQRFTVSINILIMEYFALDRFASRTEPQFGRYKTKKEEYLLIPVGQSHHDVKWGQKQHEMIKGVAVSHSILFIIIYLQKIILF